MKIVTVTDELFWSTKAFSSNWKEGRFVKFEPAFQQAERQWDETQYGAITSLTHHPKVKWLDDFSLETGFDFQQQKCSGLYLWWPRPGKWKGALTIKSRSSSQRFIYDLHKVVAGVYGLVMLLVLTFTGICLEIPEYTNPMIGFFSTLEEPPKPQSQLPTATQSFISIDAAVGIAQHIYPEAELRWIETPHGPTGYFSHQSSSSWRT